MPVAAAPVRLPLRDDVDARVAELIANIAEACRRLPGEDQNAANKRSAEEFLARVKRDFPGQCLATRQPISSFYVRTTDANYVYTVPGQSEAELVLVAHYDTWRGPGADDNTTGEEILKQYLLDDLRNGEPPPLTHTYVFAGSEECGMVGFLSQCLLAAGLVAANLAYQSGNLIEGALALLALPLAKYRFGVAGSRTYVHSLAPERLAKTKAVLAVDAVGEGRLYILRETMGADFVRAFVPFQGYRRLNDLLEEGAHLQGIKYNSFLSGGTTDHVSWMEVNNGLLDRVRRLCGAERPTIPAAAIVAMCPGKASPFVFGGKIHTPNDTPDRIYPQPLAEALEIVDYFFHVMQGGARPAEPRAPADCHYARLYRASDGSAFLALKDAVEPNRRNINIVYRVDATAREQGAGAAAAVRINQAAGWGVDTSLEAQVKALLPHARLRRVYATEIHVENGPLFLRRFGLLRRLRAAGHTAVGKAEEWMGRFSFAVFFAAAFAVAEAFTLALDSVFRVSEPFATWFFRVPWLSIPTVVVIQFAVIAWLFAAGIPTWIDNSYRHLNRADNLMSLKRAGPRTQEIRGSTTRGDGPVS